MTNGFHSHYCPRCKADKDCAQITHCRKLAKALCADCVYEDYLKQNETNMDKATEHHYHAYGGGTFGED